MSHGTDEREGPTPPPATTSSNQSRSCDINLFVDSVKPIIDAALVLAGPERSEHNSTEDTKPAWDVLKTTANSIWAVAEAARVEASTKYTLQEAQIKRANQLPEYTEGTSKTHGPKVTEVQVPKRRELDASKYAYSGLVGSISWEILERMSEDKLKDLDEMLRRIVRRICIYGIGWETIGSTIHEELVGFGLPFASSKELESDSEWARVADTSSSDLSRIVDTLDCYRDCHKEWYPNEMVHVVRRLMEIRGSQS